MDFERRADIEGAVSGRAGANWAAYTLDAAKEDTAPLGSRGLAFACAPNSGLDELSLAPNLRGALALHLIAPVVAVLSGTTN
jgi:hypothetical protein